MCPFIHGFNEVFEQPIRAGYEGCTSEEGPAAVFEVLTFVREMFL